MLRWVQRITFAVLLTGIVVHSVAAETLVLPLFSEEGVSSYCNEAEDRIAQAKDTINVMLSSAGLDGHPLIDALIAAQARGVSVRVLLDASEWAPSITDRHRVVLARLQAGGVDARFDDPDVTTHAKLLIIDHETVLLGSSNWNEYALTAHRQVDVLVDEPTIASFYDEYFNAVWDGDYKDLEIEFAPPTESAGSPAIVPLGDWPDSCCYARTALDLLEGAKRSVCVQLYRMSYYSEYSDSFSNQLIQAVIAAAGRGLRVQVLLDDCAYYADAAEANLLAALFLNGRGVDVRFDQAVETTHGKLIVIDEETVILGSTNWNYYSLEQNVEVDIAFLGIPELGRQFASYFDRLWRAGRPITD